MNKLFSLLLLLGFVGTANANWDYYHGDQNAALLDFTLGSFPGYERMYGAYQEDGTNLLFNQYANDANYVSAHKEKYGAAPNNSDMSNYHNVLSFIDSYEQTRRALNGINEPWNQNGLWDFTKPFNQLGFPKSNDLFSSSVSI
ncbi:MAG: hypothetical protein SGJ18_09860 [Pseudomonadota bacterium]|nr:hypothetical protein [Pseudomonadota bacterium]